MKRYAIVRVDKDCPNRLENLGFACATSKKKFDCVNCRYGDTKEQLISKVAQVIRKRTDNGIIVRYREDSISAEKLAKEIVEFLGVEE